MLEPDGQGIQRRTKDNGCATVSGPDAGERLRMLPTRAAPHSLHQRLFGRLLPMGQVA
jgi:hypothetical protein